MVHFKSRSLWLLAVLMVMLAANFVNAPLSTPTALAASRSQAPRAGTPDFGPNVLIFDPSMPITDIQTAVNNIANQQVDSEMGTNRYALLFKPGTYGTADVPLVFQVGYYTEVAGLGQSPTDVVINGHVDVYNRCLTPTNCIALDNFWRSLSNLTINVQGLGGCRSNDFWAVSQAAPMRRVNIKGGLTFMDYCTAGPQYASGGFMADSVVTSTAINGSQQQFLVRDSNIGGWSNGVWNQVFAGVVGAPAQTFSTTTPGGPDPYTTLPTDPISREKPYLYFDGTGNYNVFVPNLRTNSVGASWISGTTPGVSLPISNFFVAKPTDSSATINSALASGKNLIFTPGIYQITSTIQITRRDTVVLGMGMATLIPNNGVVAISVGDVAGVKVSGLIIDAGTVTSPVLFQVGTSHGHGVSTDPTLLQDIFIRIGGATPGSATLGLVVNSDYAILDDIWSWRADHGNGVGWTVNTADTGVVVNGDNVTATGLFVEHYQKYNVIWNGENGKTIFFQNELPYDAPNQAAWSHNGINGYAAYKVGDNVQVHEGWGLGSYCFFNVDPTIHTAHAFEVPRTPGVKLHDILTVSLNGDGIIDHVVNNTGKAAQGNATVPVNLISFPSLDSFTLTSSENPALVGDTITFTASAMPITATGTVTFTEGVSNTLGTAPLVNGTAVYTTSSLPAGIHQITATYSGDGTFALEATNPFNQAVTTCPALQITATDDDGTGTVCGSLSYALALPPLGTGTTPVTITFALTQGNLITFTGSLTATAKVQPYVTIMGGVAGTSSRVVINGNGVAGDGLHLLGHDTLVNLTIEHFAGRQLVIEKGPNRLQGVIARR